MTAPAVFISYSQDSDEHNARVLELANRLRADGINANIDQYQINPPEGWHLWMEKQIRDSQFVILLCTETYLKRVMKEDDGKGKGVMWESTIIYSYLYDAGLVNEKFIPIVFGAEHTKHIPMPLKPTSYYDINTDKGYEGLYRRITNQPATTVPDLGKLKSLPQRAAITLSRLPSTSSDLFGRENELKQLDDAWNEQNINILSLVAWGGVGKSALVNKWLTQMGRDNYRGAERVYGWSFYSQGAREGVQTSADVFIADALTWFGDPDPTAGSAWDKGERLAELIKQQRTLLILDGLEPLQNPPPVETGRIKDPALTSLLRELAVQNPGLVVISTRLAVEDLKQYVIANEVKQSPAGKEVASRRLAMTGTALEIDLESLSDEAGADYLAYLGVDGTETERQEASHEFGGHALALTLMGRYLTDIYDGDIRKRKEIPHLMHEEEKGGHAKRVMQAYEKWFEGKSELDLLTIMGLFDRPIAKGAMDALLAAPVIDSLTNKIQGLPVEKYKLVLKHLRKARLLAEQDPYAPDELDCHPLLREHFGEQLKEANPAAWREGNNRLYEYYKASAKELPDTLEEMSPLFAAVMHGCQAGKYEEALFEVYLRRIQRGEEYFSTNKLGAWSSDLAALSNFFTTPWNQIVDGISEKNMAAIMRLVGFRLRVLGRLKEAITPTKHSIATAIEQNDWIEASICAANYGRLYTLIGDLDAALEISHHGVELADRSNDYFERMRNRTTLADVLHNMGRFEEAGNIFKEAELIQLNSQIGLPLLFSLWGYRYCDFLITMEKYSQVVDRAKKMLEWAEQGIGRNMGILDLALSSLILGRGYYYLSVKTSSEEMELTQLYIGKAILNLRKSSQQDELPRCLLASAEINSALGGFDIARSYLDEVSAIATHCGMGLYLTDCQLEYARLYLAKSEKDKARQYWEIAKKSIEKMGYHRRDKEMHALEQELA